MFIYLFFAIVVTSEVIDVSTTGVSATEANVTWSSVQGTYSVSSFTLSLNESNRVVSIFLEFSGFFVFSCLCCFSSS